MVKTSPWTKLLPVLGIALAVILILAVASLVFGTGAGASGDGSLGRLVAATQAARADMTAAFSGTPESVAALRLAGADIERLRAVAGTSGAAPDLIADSPMWQALTSNLASVSVAGETLIAFRQQREILMDLAPQLLARTGELMSELSPSELSANQSFMQQFETTVQRMQLSVQSLERPGGADVALAGLIDSRDFLGEIIRGLSGEDTSLGVSPVSSETAAETLTATTELFQTARASVDSMTAVSEQISAAQIAIENFDQAASELNRAYQQTTSAVTADSRWPLYLVGLALLIMLAMVVAYYGARDYRRAAAVQAEQNERDQQAILRLLDELSNLADGDLTVQATVTEDITGAIADSINYAIEALRDLVTTVNDSSILVDAAAKQTEGTARQLVMASETQAKQAAAASESVSKLATSVEEISGNAERCSDVARHAVDISHKGGDAVRRTIAGMNTIRETIQDTSKRIKRLGESSQEIGNIVELIEEIAEQTNILALNASIEASRAGEASRGFAVVADEVQKLAERSSNATRKIEVLVSTIQSDTNEAVVSMERSTTDVVGGALLAENAGAALDEIEQVSHQIASLVQNISGTARDQSLVSGAITSNMQVLHKISSKATESTSHTSVAISKLSELASQLRRTVKGFTLPDQGGNTGILTEEQIAESLRHEIPSHDTTVPGLEPRRQSG